MSDPLHIRHDELEALADGVRAEHRSKFVRRDSERFKHSSYAGLMSRGSFTRTKYAGCTYVLIAGGTVRELMASEIAKFQAAVQRCIDAKDAA